ncbi:MAG: 2-amino-4-hydroxy-6-hydroxymethyldihydropteridine diphosphokinase [Spirochaetales bacterium]|nr:2-amino-4-hydroxy-6-hydroxymethyldihydropteridine diphosphokinase [Spirochaetales bacterium]
MKKRKDEKVIISIGSNIEAHSNIVIAMVLLAAEVEIIDCSKFYRTTPVGNKDQPDFINGACLIQTHIPPRELKFDFLREIERILGRIRTEDVNAPRQIDLDIALYGEQIINEEGLFVPDPGLVKYPFVGIPVRELVGNIIIPGTETHLDDIFPHGAKHYGFKQDEKITAACKSISLEKA